MATKKAKKKVKATKPRRAAAKRKPTAKLPASGNLGGGPPGLDKCNVPEICRYLERLYDYLRYEFYPDYQAVRIALCNVEDQAFGGNGDPNKPPRFCTGTGSNEPADPPKPPVW